MKNNNVALNAAKSVINQGYEASVIQRAVKRAGKNVNLKGHINELRTVDKINANPVNLIKRNRAQLTKSPTAIRDDIIVKNGKKIIKRIQAKDTTSLSGAAKTAKQMSKGKYHGTNVVGTKETVAKVMSQKGMENCKQKIVSNGLRSIDNERIAAKAMGAKGLKESVKLASSGTAKVAGSSAAISGALEIASSVPKLINGEMGVKDIVYKTGKESALAAAGGVASKVAGDLAAIGLSTLAGGVVGTAGALVVSVGSSIAVDKAGRKVIDTIEKKKDKERSSN